MAAYNQAIVVEMSDSLRELNKWVVKVHGQKHYSHIIHLIDVIRLTPSYGVLREIALCHDILSMVTADQLAEKLKQFGYLPFQVEEIVNSVTLLNGPVVDMKGKKGIHARIVKLADLISEVRQKAKYGTKDEIRNFLQQMYYMLEYLTGANHDLYMKAVKSYYEVKQQLTDAAELK